MVRSTRPRVGYLGPQGTFSEEALLSSAEPGVVEPVPVAAIVDAVAALRRGEVQWAIAPIENSLEGSIDVTLDLLAGEASDVAIVAEALLRVRHALITTESVDLAEIDTVLSHPQVLGQCAVFLREQLPRARTLPASSSAEAVRTITRERRGQQAALGTELAAEIYGGTVMRTGVEDRDDNQTRFVWLARAGETRPAPVRNHGSATWKTSIVFWGAGAERPGWLVHCLDEFARREINLTKIESRPRRERLGSYMFFADLAGSAAEAAVAEALEGLRALCELRILGSYPAATLRR